LRQLPDVHVLRDPTRGGLATTLNEIASASGVTCEIVEDDIPVRAEVKGGCSLLGLDPLYLANEGKFICIVPEADAEAALAIMRADPLCAGPSASAPCCPRTSRALPAACCSGPAWRQAPARNARRRTAAAHLLGARKARIGPPGFRPIAREEAGGCCSSPLPRGASTRYI
jgi:hypothetical protein